MLSFRHHAASSPERCSSRWWNSADRDDELVAHTAPECTRLCKGEMMRIRRHAAAHEARLSQHEFPVVLIAQADRFS